MKNIKNFFRYLYPSRLLNQKAQHIMEYTMVITLVVAAVVTMGPYVIRAWNANLRGWEDSAEDSFNDPLLEAKDDIQLPYCTCSDWVMGACNGGSCTPYQRHYTRVCNPQGCSNPEKCELDCACCTYIEHACGVNASPPCPDGQMRNTVQCCDQAPYSACLPDVDCIFVCQNPFPPVAAQAYRYGDICTDDNTRLPGDMLWIAVDGDFPGPNGCTDARKCEHRCADGFVPDIGGANCECPGNHIDNGSACVCDWQNGWVEGEGCGNNAYRDGCAAGRSADRLQ